MRGNDWINLVAGVVMTVAASGSVAALSPYPSTGWTSLLLGGIWVATGFRRDGLQRWNWYLMPIFFALAGIGVHAIASRWVMP